MQCFNKFKLRQAEAHIIHRNLRKANAYKANLWILTALFLLYLICEYFSWIRTFEQFVCVVEGKGSDYPNYSLKNNPFI